MEKSKTELIKDLEQSLPPHGAVGARISSSPRNYLDA